MLVCELISTIEGGSVDLDSFAFILSNMIPMLLSCLTGDHFLKPYVISKPEVVVTERTDLDEFLILASDGLWDVVSNEMACDVVRRCLAGRSLRRSGKGSAAEAAAVLARLAVGRGSKDNISVVVIELSRHNRCFFR